MQYFHIFFPLISVDLTAVLSQGLVLHDNVLRVTSFHKSLLISTAFEPGFQSFSILQSPEHHIYEYFRNLKINFFFSLIFGIIRVWK